MSFLTGPGQYALDSITVEHAHWGSLPIPAGFRLRLYASAGYPPLSATAPLLVELTNPTLNPAPTQFPGFSQDLLKFSVNGTVVPEPPRWAMGLAGIGLLTATLTTRCRRSRRARM